MARMYSRGHGKHGSKHPAIKRRPRWCKMEKKEIEDIVIDLSKKRHNQALIGTILRDQYGVPDVKMMIFVNSVSISSR